MEDLRAATRKVTQLLEDKFASALMRQQLNNVKEQFKGWPERLDRMCKDLPEPLEGLESELRRAESLEAAFYRT